MIDPETLCVGVDGGATSVRAFAVQVTGEHLATVGEPAVQRHERVRGFTPAPLADQMGEARTDGPEPSAEEREQARAFLADTVEVVTRIAAREGRGRLLVAVCLPGLPADDGRSIVVMRNGPRLPRFLDELDTALEERSLELAGGAARILADGEAAGYGEEHGAGGRFQGAASALLVAAGTGVAEALKVEGACLSHPEMRELIEAPWKLEAGGGRTLEDAVSMVALNRAHAETRSMDLPEDAARAGDAAAGELLAEAARATADLCFHRLVALHTRGAPLDRIVLAQHSGRLFADPALAEVFRAPLENQLAVRLREAQGDLMHATLAGESLKPGFVVASPLEAAPALGAVASALGLVRRRARG